MEVIIENWGVITICWCVLMIASGIINEAYEKLEDADWCEKGMDFLYKYKKYFVINLFHLMFQVIWGLTYFFALPLIVLIKVLVVGLDIFWLFRRT